MPPRDSAWRRGGHRSRPPDSQAPASARRQDSPAWHRGPLRSPDVRQKGPVNAQNKAPAWQLPVAVQCSPHSRRLLVDGGSPGPAGLAAPDCPSPESRPHVAVRPVGSAGPRKRGSLPAYFGLGLDQPGRCSLHHTRLGVFLGVSSPELAAGIQQKPGASRNKIKLCGLEELGCTAPWRPRGPCAIGVQWSLGLSSVWPSGPHTRGPLPMPEATLTERRVPRLVMPAARGSKSEQRNAEARLWGPPHSPRGGQSAPAVRPEPSRKRPRGHGSPGPRADP